jgi:hypothetical protein
VATRRQVPYSTLRAPGDVRSTAFMSHQKQLMLVLSRREGEPSERGAGCNGPRRPHGSTAAAAWSDGAFATVDYGDERCNKMTSAAKAALDAAPGPRLRASVRERSDQTVLGERVGIASSNYDVLGGFPTCHLPLLHSDEA